jgi:hypothetical protein
MTRWIIALSLTAGLAGTTPVADAASSSSASRGSQSDGQIHGRIQGVSNTVFTIGTSSGHARHHRARTKGLVVHYNPQTATITVDGRTVQVLDSSAMGKYVSITGTMKNAVLEATSITVSSTPPVHYGKSKSAK